MSATLVQRVQELALDGGQEQVQDYEYITYTWTGTQDGSGIEEFYCKLRGGGVVRYTGVYHPNVVCEGNPCRYCGRTVME